MGALLAADASAAGVVDGSGRLPLALAASAGCSGDPEALALLWVAAPADLRLQWAATYLGGAVDVDDQEVVAQAMVTNAEWQRNAAALALFRALLDGQRFELITKHLPAAAKAVAAVETAADVEVLLVAAALAGAAVVELPRLNWYARLAAGSEGVDRKAGDAVVLRAGLAERKGSGACCGWGSRRS